jgi:hypothetical protein
MVRYRIAAIRERRIVMRELDGVRGVIAVGMMAWE